jgi:hypothetical protein
MVYLSRFVASKWLTIILSLITAVLLAVHLSGIYFALILKSPYEAAWRFYFDKRLNFPFFFSVALLFLTLYFIYGIVQQVQKDASQVVFWKVLGLVFILFAIDESIDLHNKFKKVTYGTIASYDQTSLSHYVWVIPYVLVFGILMILILRNATHIPPYLKRDLAIAAILFLFGAVCMEFYGTYYYAFNQKTDLHLLLIKTVEELFQMIGLIVFIHVLATHYYHLKDNA